MLPFSRSKRSFPWLALWLVAFGLSFGPTGRAHAQSMGKTVVVPFGVPDGRPALSPADALEGELTQRRVRVVSMHEAREALQHVAFGRTAAAEKSVREVMVRAERTLESLNRETAQARQILDTCLSLVRNSLHEGKREEAVDQAMRCRRLVPDLAPSDSAHPANVVGVLAEADDLLRRMRTGKLTVKSQPDTGCSVYLNGRHLGTTPFVLERAASGEYRVQVECVQGKAGRVHTVQLGDEPASMTVDTAFDRAIFSDPRLFLSYETERATRRFLVDHAVSIGREVRAEDVLLVRVQGNVAELIRVQVAQNRMVGRVRATWTSGGFDKASLTHAMAVLSEGRLESEPLGKLEPAAVVAPAVVVAPPPAAPEAAAQAAESKPAPPAEQPASDGYPAWRTRTGYALIPLALVFAGVGFGLDAWAQSLRDDLVDASSGDAPPTGLQDQYDSVAAASYLGVVSGVLGVTSVALLAKPRASVPWWSYALGVAGLGVAGVGIYQVAISDQCALRGELDICLRREDTVRRGVLLVSAAAPLISLPIFHLVRRRHGQAEAQVSALTVPGGAGLTLHARY